MAGDYDDPKYRRGYDPDYDDDPEEGWYNPRVAPGKLSRVGRIYGRIDRAAESAAPVQVDPERIDAASRSNGQALPDDLRAELEQSSGADLSNVRIHTDGASGDAARSIHAKAFTTGSDIFFAPSNYDPGSADGRHLIAHEVAHTVQQSGAPAAPQAKLEVSTPGDALEVEANQFADAFAAGERVTVSRSAAPVVAREEDDRPGARQAQTAPPASGDTSAIQGLPDARTQVARVSQLFPVVISQDVPRFRAAVESLDPIAARAALSQLVGHMTTMRIAVEGAALQAIPDPSRGEQPAGAQDSLLVEIDRAREMLTGLGNIVMPNVGPGSFFGIGASVPPLGPQPDISVASHGEGTIRALQAAQSIDAILGSDPTRATPDRRRAATFVLWTVPKGADETALVEAILATRPGQSEVLGFNVLGTLVEGMGGPAVGIAFATSGIQQMAYDIVASIEQSVKYAPEVLESVWDDIQHHYRDIVSAVITFMIAEAVAAALAVNPHPAAKLVGLAIQAALLYLIASAGLDAAIALGESAVDWLILCRDAKADPKKIAAAARAFCHVILNALNLLMAATGVKGSPGSSRLLGKMFGKGKGRAGELPEAKVVDRGKGRRKDDEGGPDRDPDSQRRGQDRDADGPERESQGPHGNPLDSPEFDAAAAGGDPTALRGNINEANGLPRGAPWTGYRAHHIVPSDLLRHAVIKKIGMQLDHPNNGVALPFANERATALSSHRGYHSAYNKAFKRHLDQLDSNLPKEQLQQQVKQLQGNARRHLENGVPLHQAGRQSVAQLEELWYKLLSR